MSSQNQPQPPDGGNAGGQGTPAGSGRPAVPPRMGMKPIPLFKAAGINVSLHPAWFIVPVYFFYTGQGKYHSPIWNGIECIGMFAIVLMHEFGHAFACRSTGGKADRILLMPLGGIAYVQPPPRPGAFLWSIAAGPLVNVALLPVTWFFFQYGMTSNWAQEAPDLLQFAGEMVSINITLLIFNMLPVYPLDGGQIVQSLLWFAIGRAYSLLVVSVIGFAAAAAAGIAAVYYDTVTIPYIGRVQFSQMWFIFLAFFMGQRSAMAFKRAQAMVRIEKMPRATGYACPECGEAPFAEEIWLCDACQTRFNPFVTGKNCPHCGKPHENIRCPFCGKLNPLERWSRRA